MNRIHMEHARSSDMEDLMAKIRAELRPKLTEGEFSDEEIDQTIFAVVNQGPNLSSAELLLQLQGDLCDRCGACCSFWDTITIQQKELLEIAKHLRLKPDKLMRKYQIVQENEHGFVTDEFTIRGRPCPFLKGKNHCSIYSVRPSVCRGYPAFPIMDQIEDGEEGVEISPHCHAIPKWLAEISSRELVRKKSSMSGQSTWGSKAQSRFLTVEK